MHEPACLAGSNHLLNAAVAGQVLYLLLSLSKKSETIIFTQVFFRKILPTLKVDRPSSFRYASINTVSSREPILSKPGARERLEATALS